MLSIYSPFRTMQIRFSFKAILFILLLANACSQQQTKPETQALITPSLSKQVLPPLKSSEGNYFASNVSGDYASYPALQQFINEMVQKHGFKREYLNGLFSNAKRKQWTLDYLANSDQSLYGKPAKGGWTKYRGQFLDTNHIANGVAFWHKHQASLQKASQQFGVPPEYILGIIGVETGFGANVGKHRIIDALTTLSFDYQRRSEYFRSELENYLLMTRDEGLDPGKPVGSFAGAMGLGQFMPSSFRQWSVDLDGDGRRDLWQADDAIGSVANYFAQHGWHPGEPVVTATKNKLKEITIEPGIDHQYSFDQLKQAGLEPYGACQCNNPLRLLLLRHQTHDEYLFGHPNFYTISRYNHSTYYVMAVHELAQAIKHDYQ